MFKRIPPIPCLAVACLASVPALAAVPLLQVGTPLPQTLDLTVLDTRELIPLDPRDPAQMERARLAWEPLLAPLKGSRRVRLLLPGQPLRQALLLAASQALKAQNPDCLLFLGCLPGQAPLWDEVAWGALDGGLLLPEDLGPDPGQWEARLLQAQAQMPGRPWLLWLDQDPGAHLGTLLGDGARLRLPDQGPAALLAQALPADVQDVEGGPGALTCAAPAGLTQHWGFKAGAWSRAPLPAERTVVAVTARADYDLGALLARVRASSLRNRAALRTLEGTLRVDLHVQKKSGTGQDVGYQYDLYNKAGEEEELVRREVLVAGVRANLGSKATLPIVEASVSLAVPVALAPTERFHYADGGPGGPGLRRIRFEPVAPDPAMPRGELLVEEASGQILKETSNREGLSGKVRSVSQTLEYGEVLAGVYRVVKATSFERWLTSTSVEQVRRSLAYEQLRPNQPGFEARRQAARASNAFMLKETVNGVRYFVKRDDGDRVAELKLSSSSRAWAFGLYALPGVQPPLLPLIARTGTDNNLGDRGIQVTYLTAIVFNMVQVTVPRLVWGVDFSVSSLSLLLPETLQPVRQGHVLRQDGVGTRYGNANLTFSRDLGWGFRASLEGRFQYDSYTVNRDLVAYPTQGYLAPPNGVTREARERLLWQQDGFQASAFYGRGQRPQGAYGDPGALAQVPDQGRFSRWGVLAGYDLVLPTRTILHFEGGDLSGRGFDRFKSLDLTDSGNATVTGFSPHAFTSDHALYGKVACVLPPSPSLRLTIGLEEARIRALDDHRQYEFTGLAMNADFPGFWKITSVRAELGLGLHSSMAGARAATGSIMFLSVF